MKTVPISKEIFLFQKENEIENDVILIIRMKFKISSNKS
jgi:hypothetical protein